MGYKILRFFQNEKHPTQVLETGLTLEEVQVHCKDPESSSRTCEGSEGIARTEQYGTWFDGYDEE